MNHPVILGKYKSLDTFEICSTILKPCQYENSRDDASLEVFVKAGVFFVDINLRATTLPTKTSSKRDVVKFFARFPSATTPDDLSTQI